MQKSPSRPVGRIARWLVPSLGSYSILVVLVLLIRSSWRFLADSDTGWHLRNGEWILRYHAVPHVDIFSYTMAGREWFAWEWLSDVLLWTAHTWAGLQGVVVVSMLVLLVSFAALYHLMIRRGADPVIALFVISFGAVATQVHWLARPHLLSILLMVAWYAMVEEYRCRRSKVVFLVPLLIVLWANTHGAFVITIPLLVIYAVGEITEALLRKDTSNLRRVTATYAVVAALSLVAALANPYGYQLYGHLWHYLSDKSLLATINEFQSPDFHALDGKLIEILLLLGAIAAGAALLRRRVVEPLLFLLVAHMTLQSERHVTVAVVLLTPIIAHEFTGLIGRASEALSRQDNQLGRLWTGIKSRYQGFVAIDRQLRGGLLFLIVIAFMIQAARSPASVDFLKAHFDPVSFPVGAADYLATTLPDGNLYAGEKFGGYFIYRLFPRVKVFADGRSDLYNGGRVLEDVRKLSALKPDWSEVLERNQVDWMVLEREAPLAVVVEMTGQWDNVYEDGTSRIVVRKTGKR